MELTKSQIEDLFKFTKQHYVEWYDLQCELVDHLADNIEAIWQNEPNLTFEKARDISFKKFGIFGFMDIIDKKAKSLSKRYWKIIWNEFKTFFTIPKMFLTVLLYFSTLFIIQMVNYNPNIIIFTTFSLFIYPFIFVFKERKKSKRKFKETGKRWMLEQQIFNLGGLISLIQIPIQTIIMFDTNQEMQRFQYYIAGFLVVCGLLIYISTTIIPPKIKAIIAKENPEYQIID